MKIELTKSAPQFDVLWWVLQAKAKDPTRYAMNLVQVTERCICATDGFRIHFAKGNFPDWITGKPGLYEVVKYAKSHIIMLLVDDPGKFPVWEDIIPAHNHYFQDFEVSGSSRTSDESVYCFFECARQGILLNPSLLSDAWTDHAKCFYGEPDQPIYLTGDMRSFTTGAVIMHCNAPVAKLCEVEPKATT